MTCQHIHDKHDMSPVHQLCDITAWHLYHYWDIAPNHHQGQGATEAQITHSQGKCIKQHAGAVMLKKQGLPADMNFQTAASCPCCALSCLRAAMRASLPTGAVLGRAFVRFHKARLQDIENRWCVHISHATRHTVTQPCKVSFVDVHFTCKLTKVTKVKVIDMCKASELSKMLQLAFDTTLAVKETSIYITQKLQAVK